MNTNSQMTSQRVPVKMDWSDVMEWDVRNWSLAGDFWMTNTKLDVGRCRALDIGARNGGVSLFLLLNGANVICSDLDGPTEKAREIHARYGLSDRVAYARVNALQMPYPDESFDIVTFKSVMGGMRTYQNQLQMVNEICRVLKPGGELWFAENLAGSLLHKLLRRLFVKWGKSWRYLTFREIEELTSPFEDTAMVRYGFWAAFGRSEPWRRRLSKLDRLFDRFTPTRWKYIVFAVSRKPEKR